MITNLSNDPVDIPVQQTLFYVEFLHKKAYLPVKINKDNFVSQETRKLSNETISAPFLLANTLFKVLLQDSPPNENLINL